MSISKINFLFRVEMTQKGGDTTTFVSDERGKIVQDVENLHELGITFIVHKDT
jgi:hypothetical protein